MIDFDRYDAPTWDDLPLSPINPESDGDNAKREALRDSFAEFQDGPAANLHRNMIAGNASPRMLRDAVRRLANMLQVSGEVGDYQTEAEIVHTLTNLTMVAQKTIYE